MCLCKTKTINTLYNKLNPYIYEKVNYNAAVIGILFRNLCTGCHQAGYHEKTQDRKVHEKERSKRQNEKGQKGHYAKRYHEKTMVNIRLMFSV